MGLLRSLAKKVLGRPETASSTGAGATKAASGDGATGAATKPATGSTEKAASTDKAGTEKPWYLDGQNDGWDTTDVKKE